MKLRERIVTKDLPEQNQGYWLLRRSLRHIRNPLDKKIK